MPITGGQGQISGRFTVEQANNLSVLLRAGALPAPLTIVEERTVGPGLGQDSIEAGKKASYVATILVVGFMLVTYGLFGLFANLALAVHVLLIFAPDVAARLDADAAGHRRHRADDRHGGGFQRADLRANTRGGEAGRSMISSLEAGFQRAFATIIDSNVTMFISAAVLFFLGSGPVKGFAVTLILGIITTVVTAVTMTRMMIALWYRWARPTHLPF